MIDRSYLPFHRARLSRSRDAEVDGFSFSEHKLVHSAILNRWLFRRSLNPAEKLLFSLPAYVGQLKRCFVVKERRHKTTIIGEVATITSTPIY